MKNLLCLFVAGALQTGCVDQAMQQYEVQKQQALLVSNQYIASHPDLSNNEIWELREGMTTPAQIETVKNERANLIRRQFDGRKNYTNSHPELSPEIRSAILAGRVIVGMSAMDVLASWQTDQWQIVDSSDYGNVSISDWKCGETYVTLRNGEVFSVTYIPDYFPDY
ncbi:MAG TPA: hypothetical protein VHG71_11675 [Verrucomicrobiae bacterium]|nr:hypothetical protein [Verrucomicrobiae bacterium]